MLTTRRCVASSTRLCLSRPGLRRLETADAFFGVQGSLLAPGTGSLSFLLGQGEVRGGAASGGSAKQDKKKDRKKDKAAAKTGVVCVARAFSFGVARR